MTNEIERRVEVSKLALRAAPKGVASPGILEGYAAKFNSWSQDLGGFKEIIQPGAFDRALRENQDIRFLMNHDPSLVLGRCKSGTLGLTSDSIGLRFMCTLPDTQAGRDAHTLVKRGDVTQCSFAFRVAPNGDSWNRQRTERTLLDVDLMDCSCVTYPAYLDTEVDARSRIFQSPDLALREKVRALGAKIAADDAAADDFDYATASPEAIRVRVQRLVERSQRLDLRNMHANDSADIARMVREMQGR
jgi:uncharacterized protein